MPSGPHSPLPRRWTNVGGLKGFAQASAGKAGRPEVAWLVEPIVYTLDEGALSRYERPVLVE